MPNCHYPQIHCWWYIWKEKGLNMTNFSHIPATLVLLCPCLTNIRVLSSLVAHRFDVVVKAGERQKFKKKLQQITYYSSTGSDKDN